MSESPSHDLAAGFTDKGLVRSTNQDSFWVDASERIYIVADGMGGHAGGEIASKLAVEAICAVLRNPRGPTGRSEESPNADPRGDQAAMNHLALAINTASTKVFDRALEEPELKGMGTTATVVMLAPNSNRAYYGHVGDSRFYLIRQGLIYRITHDHSLVGEQVRAGLITPEEAESHSLRNVITRSVGYQEEEEVDTGYLSVEPGDYLVLCSDGLYGKVSDVEISKMVQKHSLDAGLPLISLANARGGEDNITVVLVRPQVGG